MDQSLQEGITERLQNRHRLTEDRNQNIMKPKEITKRQLVVLCERVGGPKQQRQTEGNGENGGGVEGSRVTC